MKAFDITKLTVVLKSSDIVQCYSKLH